MEQIKKLLFVLFLVSVFTSLTSCGASQSNVLLNVIPDSPVLFTTGPDNTIGTITISTPYFEITSMTIAWTGQANFQILAIKIFSIGSLADLSGPVICSIGGDDLTSILGGQSGLLQFPQLPNISTNITTGSFGCGTLPLNFLNDPTHVYNIPLTLQVIGVVLDPTTGVPTGRQVGSTTITLQ